MPSSFTSYILSKNVTSQKLKGKNLSDAFNNTSAFISNCTTCNPESPKSISLHSYSAYDDKDDPKIAVEIFDDLTRLFGGGKTMPLSYHYPSGVPGRNTKTEWDINEIQLKDALKYLINGQPWPKYTFGPLDLVLSYTFKLIDPITKTLLPNQKFDSSLIVWLSRNCNCSPIIYFPFEPLSDAFNKYLAEIDTYIPFVLNHKYLRRATDGKNGIIYRKL